jgi:hypothetical protein
MKAVEKSNTWENFFLWVACLGGLNNKENEEQPTAVSFNMHWYKAIDFQQEKTQKVP